MCAYRGDVVATSSGERRRADRSTGCTCRRSSARRCCRRQGEAPPYRFGLTTGWYANELRRDEALAGTLMKEGRPPIEKLMATYYPSDGIELAVRREKVAGKVWLLRLAASAMSGGRPGMVVWPAGTAERATDGWLKLRLP